MKRKPIPVELALKKMKFRLDDNARAKIDALVAKADFTALSMGDQWNLNTSAVGKRMRDLYFLLEGKPFVDPAA